jgi:hypothetical protein
MHLIVNISVSKTGNFESCDIIDHTGLGISSGLILLENSVRAYIKNECGQKAGDDMKVITILDWNQVAEPSLDKILVYRLESDPHKLHIYQRKTEEIAGWFGGKTPVTGFGRIKIFELIEYNNFGTCVKKENPIREFGIPIEMVLVGPAKIPIPKAMTISPMCDVIAQLSMSPAFLKRREIVEQDSCDLYESYSPIMEIVDQQLIIEACND